MGSKTYLRPSETRELDAEAGYEKPVLDDNGHLCFSENDPENPKSWSTVKKCYITAIVVLLALNATFASSAPTGALFDIAAYFNVSLVAANLVTTLFLLGYCFGPLLWAPLSEFYGRRYVFYISFVGYFAFNFLCAFTPNFAGLLVGRFLTGSFASSSMSNAPGVLVDIWQPVARGNAMVCFTMALFIGPVLGPITSGFLELTEGWRWSFYELLWLAAASMIILLALPETLPSIRLVQKAKAIRKAGIAGFEEIRAPTEAADQKLPSIFKSALTRPWTILIDPISLAIAIYFSILYALLYMLFTIYPIVFQEMRGWNAGVGELPLLGMVVGAVTGGCFVLWVTTREMKKQMSTTEWKAENRLPLAMIGAVLLPITMFWFAWTGNYNSINWAVPTVAGGCLAAAILLIFVSFINYLTDSYLMFAASATAANTICRSAAAAGAPLFTNQMFHTLGVGGAGSLIAGISVLLAPIPFIFFRYGEAIRRRSRFAPTPEFSGNT